MTYVLPIDGYSEFEALVVVLFAVVAVFVPVGFASVVFFPSACGAWVSALDGAAAVVDVLPQTLGFQESALFAPVVPVVGAALAIP